MTLQHLSNAEGLTLFDCLSAHEKYNHTMEMQSYVHDNAITHNTGDP
ncbi:MAG TPA: hypothetical protein HA306_00340 [Methanosarcina sp.]|nr:hypothetical protein [Methanosarcina sp.]